MNFGITPAFETIDTMVRHIEHGVIVVAFVLALAWIACEWMEA